MLVAQQGQGSSCKGLWLRPLDRKLVWSLQPNSCVYLFRRVFTERGLFAIPLDLFEFAILSSAYSSANEARAGIRPHDAMQAIAIAVSTWRDVCVPVASLHASRGPLCFFEVLCANPQNLVQSGAHHRSTPRGLVRVRQLRGVVSATMQGTVVCDGEGRYRNLDCGAWCQNPSSKVSFHPCGCAGITTLSKTTSAPRWRAPKRTCWSERRHPRFGTTT